MNDMFCQSMKGAIAPKVAGKPNIALFWRLVFIHFVALVLMAGSASLSAQDAEPVKILAVGDSLCEGDDGEASASTCARSQSSAYGVRPVYSNMPSRR